MNIWEKTRRNIRMTPNELDFVLADCNFWVLVAVHDVPTDTEYHGAFLYACRDECSFEWDDTMLTFESLTEVEAYRTAWLQEFGSEMYNQWLPLFFADLIRYDRWLMGDTDSYRFARSSSLRPIARRQHVSGRTTPYFTPRDIIDRKMA